MKTNNFKQLNLVALIERADDILSALDKVHTYPEVQRGLLEVLTNESTKLDPGDDWEHAALELAALEITERCIRQEDPTCESAPEGYHGGFGQWCKMGEKAGPDLTTQLTEPPIGPKPLEFRQVAFEQLWTSVQQGLISASKTFSTGAYPTSDQDIINVIGRMNAFDVVLLWVRWTRLTTVGVPAKDTTEAIFNILGASLP